MSGIISTHATTIRWQFLILKIATVLIDVSSVCLLLFYGRCIDKSDNTEIALFKIELLKKFAISDADRHTSPPQ